MRLKVGALRPRLARVLTRGHSRQLLEKVAETELAWKIHLVGNVSDREPVVGQQQLRPVQPHLSNMLVNGTLA